MAKFGKSIASEEEAPIITVPVAAPEPVVVAAVTPTPSPTVDNTTPPDFSVSELAELKQDEHWMKSMWRPAMGWLYMVICFMDFVAFPAISMFMPMLVKGMTYIAWQSLTLSNGGLIHMAFGAILGVAAYGRTQEKVASKQ